MAHFYLLCFLLLIILRKKQHKKCRNDILRKIKAKNIFNHKRRFTKRAGINTNKKIKT